MSDKASGEGGVLCPLEIRGSGSDLFQALPGRLLGLGIDDGAIKIRKFLIMWAAISLGEERIELPFQVNHADLIGNLGEIVLVDSDKGRFQVGDESGQGISDFGDQLKEEVVDALHGLGVHDGEVRDVFCGKVDCEEELMLFSFNGDAFAIDASIATPFWRKLGSHLLSVFAVFSELMEKRENPAMIDRGL